MVRAPSALTSGSTPLKLRAWTVDASWLASAGCSVLRSEMPSSVARRSAGQLVEEFWIATLTSGGARETPAVSVEATRPTGAPSTSAAMRATPWGKRENVSRRASGEARSEEHTSELQARFDLVSRPLLV